MGFITGVRCDQCYARWDIYETVVTKKIMVQKLRKNSWSVGKMILCPTCRLSAKLHKKNPKNTPGGGLE